MRLELGQWGLSTNASTCPWRFSVSAHRPIPQGGRCQQQVGTPFDILHVDGFVERLTPGQSCADRPGLSSFSSAFIRPSRSIYHSHGAAPVTGTALGPVSADDGVHFVCVTQPQQSGGSQPGQVSSVYSTFEGSDRISLSASMNACRCVPTIMPLNS